MARTLVRFVSTFFVLDFSAAVAELITALTQIVSEVAQVFGRGRVNLAASFAAKRKKRVCGFTWSFFNSLPNGIRPLNQAWAVLLWRRYRRRPDSGVSRLSAFDLAALLFRLRR